MASEINAILETVKAMRAEMIGHSELTPGNDLDILVSGLITNLDTRNAAIGQQIQAMVRAGYVLGKLNAYCSRKSTVPMRGNSEYVRETRQLYGEWASVARELCERIVNGCDFKA